MSENTQVSRRAFAGGMGMMGLLGAMGGIPVMSVTARAQEASEAEGAEGGLTPAECMAREIEAAKAENRRLDPIKLVSDKTNDELLAMLRDETEVTEDYVTPSGKVIPALYVRLRNRINRCSAGLGSIVSGDDHWDVFMKFYSEDDAKHILQMPVDKPICAPDFAEANGYTEAEATAILDDLADRSLLWRMRRGGQGWYQIMGQIPGYWEWHELWEGVYGTQESMLEFNHGCDAAWGEDNPLAGIGRAMVHIQAPDPSVVEGETPLFCDWSASLDRFDTFAVMPCQCRTKQINYGNFTPEEIGRIETCVSMGEIAEYFISTGEARELTREEARATITESVEQGLTIEGYCTKSGGAYCACHMSVCLFANAYRALGGLSSSFQYLSDFRLAYDTEKCIQCGACLQRCPMSAIEQDENGYYQPTNICFRCGQCAITCPVEARKLVPKEKWETVERANDLFEDNMQAAKAHMALGGIQDFTGDVEAIRAASTFNPVF